MGSEMCIRDRVRDGSNLSVNSTSPAIALIRDAPAFWFGIHVAGVDDPEWGGASVLTSAPFTGIKRGHILTLKACVLDPDHEPGNQTPIFSASRGQIDGITHRTGSSVDQHCYISSFAVATSTSLDSFTLELSCLLYTSPSPRDLSTSRMPSSA